MDNNKKYIDMSLEEFSNILAAKTTMPGGGSAAAYVASLGNSLASMVANFTIGKKAYQEYDKNMEAILKDTEKLNLRLLELVDKDAEEFLKLSAAYSLPKGSEEEKILADKEKQKCLKLTASVPMDLLKECKNIVDLHEKLSIMGSKMLLSDVGVGVLMVRSAALSAKINIAINIKYILDEDFTKKYESDMQVLVKYIEEKCDKIYNEIYYKICK
ncbi:cyclodeaminase/cyclohydrolase family protein [Peptostreptococcus equinus]|uniref:Cyclodeaminase/cyclohydrolase family protein n=1 Tax=Peptostreptococcus equinus TaxID=3003601 RepID=A0ABY7JPB5_9FIRM|nr:cyclodeaminase/cyclohydrolase family protein [Peptostreptococcus sp. CBA3647]WAW15192.1 cyclodeaminase/cyclohydrolase family protein [Peptostreptococcus sp. CBA3647]